MDKLEELIHNDLQRYLLSANEIDERLPECPDVERKWEAIANAYMPNTIVGGVPAKILKMINPKE